MKEQQDIDLSEMNKKYEFLTSLLKHHNADFLLIEGQENYSWLTSGRGFIGLASTQLCGSILVSYQGLALIANNIELDRLRVEQKADHPLFSYYSFPWYESDGKDKILQHLTQGKHILSEKEVSAELQAKRTTLSKNDITRYEEICITTAIEVEEACKNLYQGMSEYELAGILSQRFWKHNLEPITLLIGFDHRALTYRHPVPAGALLDNYALVAVCTRRDGLIANATRLVSIKSDHILTTRQKISSAAESLLISQTVPGADLFDVFSNLQDLYTNLGVKDEWQKHHQGGITGFVARELKASPDTHHIVRRGEVYGWNPSVKGTKSENTIIVEENQSRVLTHTGNYPYIEHVIDNKSYLSEDILVLNQ